MTICNPMRRGALPAMLLSAALALSAAAPVLAQATPPAQITAAARALEARVIAMEAYVYLYPLVTMEITRRQISNVAPGQGFGGPMNTVVNVRAYPRAEDRAVVRPNFDTLYSSMFVDLREEPMLLSVPDTEGRYYLLPMLDMWTDVFASPGARTTGTKAGHFLLVPKGWRPDLRFRLIEEFKLPAETQIIEASTPIIWIIGRTQTNGPEDYAAAHKVQDGYRLTPLSLWGKPRKPAPFMPDPTVDMKTPPKLQVDTMSGEQFFALAAELMKTHPPHETDYAQIARLKRIGIEPGKGFDVAKADETVRKAIQQAPAEVQRLMAWRLPSLAKVVNGWQMNTETMGVYGNDYLKRALVAQVGLGANQPEDAIYPLNLADRDGRPLEGSQRYMLHFPKDALPPVNAFWSVTLYDEDGFQVANPLNRFAVSSWMPFQVNSDGSLDLIIQNDNPGPGKEANWLPAPKGKFNLTMRLYAPKASALFGRWSPPPVDRVSDLAPVTQ